MIKSYYTHFALATLGVLYLLFGPRQLFFQLCHQMKLRHTVAAPESLYIESLADNFYTAIFFQLNTYELTNCCQPRTWSYKKPYEFLKSFASTLIKGFSNLDSALIKDLDSKHTANGNVVFQQKILGRLTSKSFIFLCIFFIALFFRDSIQPVAVVGYNHVYNRARNWYNHVYNRVRNWYLNSLNMAAENDNNNNSGNIDGPRGPGGPGGPGGPSDHPGGNNNAGSLPQRKYKTEPTTRRKHLPIAKKPTAEQQASSSKAPSNVASTSKAPSNVASTSKAPSNVASTSKAPFNNAPSSGAPLINIDNAALRQAERAYKETFDRFQASFIPMNLAKTNLEGAFSKYQGLVNGLRRNYNPEPEIPLADLTSPSIDQYLASQAQLAAKIRYISQVKGKNTDTFDAVTNHLRFAKMHTDELVNEIQGYSFAMRDPFVLLTKETLSRVPPSVPERPANIPSTSHPPVPGAFSDSSSSMPGPSQRPGPAKRQFKTEEEANEFLRYMPRHETTFEDVGFDKVKTPFHVVSPPPEFQNYRFPPGEYDPPTMDPSLPPAFADDEFATSSPPMQEQAPSGRRDKGKQPMRGYAEGSTRVA